MGRTSKFLNITIQIISKHLMYNLNVFDFSLVWVVIKYNVRHIQAYIFQHEMWNVSNKESSAVIVLIRLPSTFKKTTNVELIRER